MSLVTMKEMLADAQARRYAIGMFDVSDIEMARAAVEAAETMRSPVIIAALEPDLVDGRLDYWIAVAKTAAAKATVPVCIHLDHAATVGQIKEAVEAGFTSVMLDASAQSFEENVRLSAEVVNAVKSRGLTVEAELGHVGNGWVGSGAGDTPDPDKLTEPEKVCEFVEKTGVDALAVSIGTAHGVYIKAPKLDIERLKKIRSLCDVPLVLHGGSGTPADQLTDAIHNGICKINIYSEMLNAWNTVMLEQLEALPHKAAWPSILRPKPYEAMKQVIMDKMKLFGSADRI